MAENSVIEVPVTINAKDNLGREEHSEKDAKHAFRNRNTKSRRGPRVRKFLPPNNSNEISVNRLGLASDSKMAEFGIRNAIALEKSFWGWYVLSVSDVKEANCSVKPSPYYDNPYHADITVPVALDAKDRRDELLEIARDLAYRANFQSWGDWLNYESKFFGV